MNQYSERLEGYKTGHNQKCIYSHLPRRINKNMRQIINDQIV